jgi:hypothetical protein
MRRAVESARPAPPHGGRIVIRNAGTSLRNSPHLHPDRSLSLTSNPARLAAPRVMAPTSTNRVGGLPRVPANQPDGTAPGPPTYAVRTRVEQTRTGPARRRQGGPHREKKVKAGRGGRVPPPGPPVRNMCGARAGSLALDLVRRLGSACRHGRYHCTTPFVRSSSRSDRSSCVARVHVLIKTFGLIHVFNYTV